MKESSPGLAFAYIAAALDSDFSMKDPVAALKPLILRCFHVDQFSSLNSFDLRSKIEESFGIEIPLTVINFLLNSLLNRDKAIKKRVVNHTDSYRTDYILSTTRHRSELDEIEATANEIWRRAIEIIATSKDSWGAELPQQKIFLRNFLIHLLLASLEQHHRFL